MEGLWVLEGDGNGTMVSWAGVGKELRREKGSKEKCGWLSLTKERKMVHDHNTPTPETTAKRWGESEMH